MFAVAILFLAGCQTTNSNWGTGAITLTPQVQAYFQKYLEAENSEYFAVSPDGRRAGYSYCGAGGGYCAFDNGYVALRACNNYDGPRCKIYADGKTIVWVGAENTAFQTSLKSGNRAISSTTSGGYSWSKTYTSSYIRHCSNSCMQQPESSQAYCKDFCSCTKTKMETQFDLSEMMAYDVASFKGRNPDAEISSSFRSVALVCRP